ncbi:MAG: hypothetical protein WBK77_09710, partial [Alphaproteobacteria bacterium]
MKLSPLVAVYSVTLLLSAALLFSIQPMFSKMVLPLLGGTPQVWNTAMLFFQVMLLGGYAYAHGTTRFLSIRVQAIVHLILLGLFTVVLPIAIPEGLVPPTDKDPTLWQLSLMLATVGGPFFILAGSAPMLQRWFSASGHKDADNPYFLYGASNLGSMTSLLAFPVLIEPLLSVSGQAHIWMMSYFGLVLMTFLSIALVWKNSSSRAKIVQETSAINDKITWNQRLLWLALAFVPSSLMLGVTTFITTDIASVPLLWVMPLALYVGTFIIVFARRQIISSKDCATIFAVLLIILIAQRVVDPVISPFVLIGLHLTVFFFAALNCHMELAKMRPASRHLTEFYLIMSLGGALGGFFNAIIAPTYFIVPIEYGLALFCAVALRYVSNENQTFSAFMDKAKSVIKKNGLESIMHSASITALIVIFSLVLAASYDSKVLDFACSIAVAISLAYALDRRWLFSLLTLAALFLFPLGYSINSKYFKNILSQDRNFFGVVKIVDVATGERLMLNGTTNHGTQALNEKYRLEPISYYGFNSPVRDLFQILDTQNSPQKIGVMGLGIGVLACFSHEGRSFDFFEINPLVKDIAENPNYFTFLKDCGSPYRIILGDARLTLKDQEKNGYDLLIMDAFTSDNIPMHLLTLEAVETFLEKTKEDGILMVHISNRYLDLEPVLYEISQKIGVKALARLSKEVKEYDGTKLLLFPSHWVAFSRNENTLAALRQKGWDDTLSRK